MHDPRTINFIKRNDQPEHDGRRRRVSRVPWRPRRPRPARQEWLRTSAGVWRGVRREVFRENGIVGRAQAVEKQTSLLTRLFAVVVVYTTDYTMYNKYSRSSP